MAVEEVKLEVLRYALKLPLKSNQNGHDMSAASDEFSR
jgi:hypothetical protein